MWRCDPCRGSDQLPSLLFSPVSLSASQVGFDSNIKLLDDEETGNTIYGSEPLGELHKYALLVRAVGESNNVLFLTRREPS